MRRPLVETTFKLKARHIRMYRGRVLAFVAYAAMLGCGSQTGLESGKSPLLHFDRALDPGDSSLFYDVPPCVAGDLFGRGADVAIPDMLIAVGADENGFQGGCASSSADKGGCGQEFGVDATRGVYLVTWYSGLDGDHLQHMEVFSPDQGLYAVYDDSVPTDKDQAEVVSLLRVRGTAIQSYHMVGEWNVLVFLDGKEAGAFSFVLN